MRLENHVPITQVVDVRKVPADLELAKRLGITEGEELLQVTRLRGNESYFPLALFISYLTPGSGLTGEENFEGSLYELMRSKGSPVVDGDAIIEGRLAEGKIAELLKVENGAPILYYERLGSTINNEPVELVQCWYEARHYKFRIHLSTGK
jgi:GntR family transcriptional regulator